MQNDHQLSVPELEQKYQTSATKVSWGRQRGGCREGEGERDKNIRKGQTGALQTGERRVRPRLGLRHGTPLAS